MGVVRVSIREFAEDAEFRALAERAAKSAKSRGRRNAITPCDIRTEFQRDRDRILHSKSFRRLMHKTQCFVSPEGDHFRTRLTHTLEVSQIARTISRALRLNEDLSEAIALGHDLGHTPFGHMGERTLNRLAESIGGFRHNEQSVRVVERLEHEGNGLNLTYETIDGILHHTGDPPETFEGQVVALSDRIAYINHDIDDALCAGTVRQEDLPKSAGKRLGETHGARIDAMVRDVVAYSAEHEEIGMSPDVAEATDELREFMFRRVYLAERALSEEIKADRMITALFSCLMEDHFVLPDDVRAFAGKHGRMRAVCDFIAGMTDRYATAYFERLFTPSSFGGTR